jgi:hypothetical protein
MKEIRDKQARKNFESLPYELQCREPSAEAMKVLLCRPFPVQFKPR